MDVKNAFRLLSKEYDRPNMIKIDRVKEILQEMGITELEIAQLTAQLDQHKTADGYFDFEQFIKGAF